MLVAEDRQLVDAVLAGDRDAFRVLVERESRTVIGNSYRILRDGQEAQDVAQDAFLRAYRGLATYRGDGSFGAWVARIAARLAIARLVARKDSLRIDAGALERASAFQSNDDPEVVVLLHERRERILDAVAALPEHQRDVILLHFFRDLGLQEIAEVTGRPLGTVKSRLHRGMSTLRANLVSRSMS